MAASGGLTAAEGYRRLWRNPRFRYYFASLFAGETGYSVFAIAVLLLAYETSGNLFVTAAVLFVEFGIYALSFLAGPFVDRVANLRTVLVVGYPVQAALAVAIGVLAYDGLLTVPLLLVMVVGISLAWNFTWTATNAIPPRILDPEELFRANGLINAFGAASTLLGYVAGAALIVAFPTYGTAAGALLYGALNLAAAVLILPASIPLVGRAVESLRASFVRGWRYLLQGTARPLLQLSIFSAAQAVFSAAPPLLITFLAHTVFANPNESYAVLFTVYGAGEMVGSLVVGQVNPRRHLWELLAAVSVAEGVFVLLAVLAAPLLWASILAWFAVGLVDVTFYMGLIVYFQATTPAPLLGRTLTNTYVFRGATRAMGALLVGALAAVLVPGALGVLIAVAFVAVGLLGPLVLPAVRTVRF
jgi:MFS family permease